MVVPDRGATVPNMEPTTPLFGEVLTAVITPFDADGAVDFDTFFRLIRHLGDTGSDGVVVCGTTGEAPALTADEKAALFAAAVDAVGNRMKVIANTGTYNTTESVEMTHRACALGVDGVMAVTPYYSRPPQEGIALHMEAIADASDVPVIVYNIPGRAARLIEVDTLVRLANHPRIAGVKDAVDDIAFTREAFTKLPPDFNVYAGSDHMTKDICASGGVGVISVASHVAGRQLAQLVAAARSGDTAEADRIDAGLAPLIEALFMEPSPMPVKAALTRFWGPVGDPRLPLIPASAETLRTIESAMATAGAL